ncbi:hypothetical protein V6N11_065113 [Hibiscus sabdariffa]|uniref:Uncharacterized protein n=1 Tax=Hibiscus sabdariffa TaxID=183260 RepID=A0ABR2SJ97_9ROSI
MWMGAASLDWADGRDGGGVGADPMGEAGVDCLLSCVAGVAAGVICRELIGLGRTQKQQDLKEGSCTEATPSEKT